MSDTPRESEDPVEYMISFVGSHCMRIFTDPTIDADAKQRFAEELREHCYDECLAIARFCRRMYKRRSFSQEVLPWE